MNKERLIEWSDIYMIQGFGKDLFSMMAPKSYSKRPKPSEEVRAIQAKLSGGMEAKDLSEEEYAKLAQFEQADKIAFEREVSEIFTKAEAIALKIAKGEKLTPEEEAFINEKCPDLKREAEQAKKEGEELKERLRSAKSEKDRQSILMGAMNGIASMANKGMLAPIQVRMKLEVLEKVKEELKKEGKETGEVDVHKFQNLKPGALFDRKG